MKHFFFGLLVLFGSASTHAQLLISEVLYDAPNSDATEEWIELFNASCDIVDLTHYTIKDNATEFALSGSLASGEYITIARNTQGFLNLYGFEPDISNMSLALGNSGDYVRLLNNGLEVDLVAWEGKISGWYLNAKNTTIARKNTPDTDSQNDWENTHSTGSPNSGPLLTECNPIIITPLENGGYVGAISAESNSGAYFSIEIPAGATDFFVQMWGGIGEANLFVQNNQLPTTSSFNCQANDPGNYGRCYFATPISGTYYIMVHGEETDIENVKLAVEYYPPQQSEYNFSTYYRDVLGLTGQALRDGLNTISGFNHQKMTYSQVWDALRITDEDPDNTSNVILFYSGRSQSKTFTSSGNNDPDAWNREHTWPKSHGFPSSSQWAYSDIHQLRPTDASINSDRGHKDFDWSTESVVTEAPENKYDSDSFEPRDAVKGDVARMMFYMDVRYDGNDGTNVPDLTLVNYTSTSGNNLGDKCTLLAWHRQDPIDQTELDRHDKIVMLQGNRNPFIDNPNWVDELFASQCP